MKYYVRLFLHAYDFNARSSIFIKGSISSVGFLTGQGHRSPETCIKLLSGLRNFILRNSCSSPDTFIVVLDHFLVPSSSHLTCKCSSILWFSVDSSQSIKAVRFGNMKLDNRTEQVVHVINFLKVFAGDHGRVVSTQTDLLADINTDMGRYHRHEDPSERNHNSNRKDTSKQIATICYFIATTVQQLVSVPRVFIIAMLFMSFLVLEKGFIVLCAEVTVVTKLCHKFNIQVISDNK